MRSDDGVEISSEDITCLDGLEDFFEDTYYRLEGSIVQDVVKVLSDCHELEEGGSIAGRFFEYPEVLDRACMIARDIMTLFSDGFWSLRVADILRHSDTVKLQSDSGQMGYSNGNIILVKGNDDYWDWRIFLRGDLSMTGFVSITRYFGVQVREVIANNKTRGRAFVASFPTGFLMVLYQELLNVRTDGLLDSAIPSRSEVEASVV